jgi:hypothetical protein
VGCVVLRRTFISLAFLLALVPELALGKSGIRIVNLMPAFFKADAQSLALNVRVQRFKEYVLYPNRDVYDMGYAALDDPHIAWYLNALADRVANIRKATETVEDALPKYESGFESAFPKFDPQTVAIYIMPSMGSFDGMTKDVNGKHGLLIGIDNFSAENLPLGIFVDHEMFHIYHHEINPTFFVTSSENDLYEYGLYRQLWAEGLATYVSQQLNPGSSNAAALASADLANLSPGDTRKLACLISDNLDSTQPGYSGLFFDESQHPKGLPPRGGYFIGYLVARDLGKTHSLSDLADLNGSKLHDAIADDVRALCGKQS